MHTLKDLVTLRSSFPLKDSIYSLLLLYNSIHPSYYSRMSSTDFALSHLEMCPMSACAVVLCIWAPFPSRPCHAQSSCQLVCQGKEQSVSKCWGCRTPAGDLNAAPASWLCRAQPWPSPGRCSGLRSVSRWRTPVYSPSLFLFIFQVYRSLKAEWFKSFR